MRGPPERGHCRPRSSAGEVVATPPWSHSAGGEGTIWVRLPGAVAFRSGPPTTSGPYGRGRRKKLQAEVCRPSCPVSVEETRFLGETGFLSYRYRRFVLPG